MNNLTINYLQNNASEMLIKFKQNNLTTIDFNRITDADILKYYCNHYNLNNYYLGIIIFLSFVIIGSYYYFKSKNQLDNDIYEIIIRACAFGIGLLSTILIAISIATN